MVKFCWFETPFCSLWRHCNGVSHYMNIVTQARWPMWPDTYHQENIESYNLQCSFVIWWSLIFTINHALNKHIISHGNMYYVSGNERLSNRMACHEWASGRRIQEIRTCDREGMQFIGNKMKCWESQRRTRQLNLMLLIHYPVKIPTPGQIVLVQ